MVTTKAREVLEQGAILSFRAVKMMRERQTNEDKDKLADLMLSCVPKRIRTRLDINASRVKLIIDHAPDYVADIDYFFGKNARADCCCTQEELDAALKVLQESWKGVVKITSRRGINNSSPYTTVNFQIL
mgnify:FL=1